MIQYNFSKDILTVLFVLIFWVLHWEKQISSTFQSLPYLVALDYVYHNTIYKQTLVNVLVILMSNNNTIWKQTLVNVLVILMSNNNIIWKQTLVNVLVILMSKSTKTLCYSKLEFNYYLHVHEISLLFQLLHANCCFSKLDW